MREIYLLYYENISYTSEIGLAIEKPTFDNITLLAKPRATPSGRTLKNFALLNGEYKIIRIKFKENKTPKRLSQ